jgi:hypothetical protein
MDWRETVLGFSAHASPAVGGRYYVERLAGGWIVDHEARDLDGQWCIRHIEGQWATLKEAKAAARTQHQSHPRRRPRVRP